MGVSAQVLAQIRASTARFLTETALIEQEQADVGAWGQEKPRWITVASDVPCRVVTARAMQNPTAGDVAAQETIVDTYRIIAPYGTAFAVNQRITVGSITYQVVGLNTDRTDETDTQAICTRTRADG